MKQGGVVFLLLLLLLWLWFLLLLLLCLWFCLCWGILKMFMNSFFLDVVVLLRCWCPPFTNHTIHIHYKPPTTTTSSYLSQVQSDHYITSNWKSMILLLSFRIVYLAAIIHILQKVTFFDIVLNHESSFHLSLGSFWSNWWWELIAPIC